MLKQKLRTITFFLLVSIIIGLSLYTLNAKLVLGDQMPMPLGFAASVVLTGSMEPELSGGDMVFVVKTNDLEVNDIIVYQSGKTLVIHRIIYINGDEIITQGDANSGTDDPITRDDVKGKLIFKLKGAGFAVNFFKSPFVTVAVVALALWLLDRSFRSEEKAQESDGELEKLRKEIDELKDNIKK